jgi:hypothetical protein
MQPAISPVHAVDRSQKPRPTRRLRERHRDSRTSAAAPSNVAEAAQPQTPIPTPPPQPHAEHQRRQRPNPPGTWEQHGAASHTTRLSSTAATRQTRGTPSGRCPSAPGAPTRTRSASSGVSRSRAPRNRSSRHAGSRFEGRLADGTSEGHSGRPPAWKTSSMIRIREVYVGPRRADITETASALRRDSSAWIRTRDLTIMSRAL